MFANLLIGVTERIMSRKLIALEARALARTLFSGRSSPGRPPPPPPTNSPWQPIDVSKTGLMMINNACGMVLLVPLQFAFGEAARWREIAAFSTHQWALLVLSCVVGVGISYAGINLQKYVTASTFMVLQNANKFAVVAFGMIVLQEASDALTMSTPSRIATGHIPVQANSWQAVLGCTVALGGSIWYGIEQKKDAADASVGGGRLRRELRRCDGDAASRWALGLCALLFVGHALRGGLLVQADSRVGPHHVHAGVHNNRTQAQFDVGAARDGAGHTHAHSKPPTSLARPAASKQAAQPAAAPAATNSGRRRRLLATTKQNKSAALRVG